jgi:hypothetical protein
MTQTRKVQCVALFGLLLLLSLVVQVSAVGNIPRDVRDGTDDPNRQTYSLPRARGEALAMLLRLDMPTDTAVTIREYAPRSPGVQLIISAPKKVHDVIGPLVDLLHADVAAKNMAEGEKRRKEADEFFRRSMGLAPGGYQHAK